MKNRVLALCLTVALLLGMMPAITMPTRVYAADADVNVNAVFTQETITVDGALTETSWKKATYYDVTVGDVTGKLAVVVNAGDVYVALKANAASVSAAVGGKSATGTTVSGVTELCLSDVTIGSFGAVLEMTLTVDGTAITAAVTFTQNEINLAGAEPHYYLTYGDAASGNATWSRYDQFSANGAYIALDTNSLKFSTISSNTTPGMSVDHSVDVEWYQQLRFDAADYPNIDADCTKTSASGGVNGIFYMCLNDSDPVNGGHIIPFIYRETDVYYLQFLLNTSTSVPNYSVPIMINDASRAFTRLKLLWHTDGSVSVSYAMGDYSSSGWTFGDYVDAGTVENATWPYKAKGTAGAYTAHYDVAVGHGETADVADLMNWCVGAYKSGTTNAYVYDASVTHIPSTVAIAEVNYLSDVTVPDVVEGNLPSTVAHTYLGNLPLTWTVVDGIIAADGTVTHGLEDKNVTVTAKVGDTVVVDAKTIIVKGADKLNALYTLETMTLNNTLSEKSWDRSAWYAFGDGALSGQVAAVINKGKAYIAVKSAATSGTVKLAGKEAALTFANGVAEVAVADLGLTQFENNFVMQISVTDGASTVEAMCVAVFTKTEVNTAVGTPSYLLKHGDFTAAYNLNNSAYDYYRADGSQVQFANSTSLSFINLTSVNTLNFSVDHSMDVEWMQEIQFDHSNFPNIDPNATKTGVDRGINRIFYMCLNDSDATYGGHIFPFIYREKDVYWLQFLLNTSTSSIPLYSDPIMINDASKLRTRLKLLWHTDGSVSVTYSLGDLTDSWNFGEEVYAGTVENVTWSNTGSFIANTTVGVGTNEDATQADIASWCLSTMQEGLDTQMYLYDTQLTHIAKTAAIEDGSYLEDVAIPDVVTDDLPTSVTHAYFGDLALTWSDNGAGYVSENGAIRLPEIDTKVTLTAYAGSTKVLEKEEVIIKAAEKLVALATGETIAPDGKLYEVSWRYAAWKEIGGNVPGSVAVLMKGGEAYVAIKSATATSATVTLGETTIEDVPFAGGVAEIKIADASIDSLQESFAVAVTLSDGTNTSSLEKCETVALNKQKVNSTLKGDSYVIDTAKNSSEAGTRFLASADFSNGNQCLKKNEYAIIQKEHFEVDHSKDLYVEQLFKPQCMPLTDGSFNTAAQNSDPGYRIRILDYDARASVGLNIYRADGEAAYTSKGKVMARVVLADRTLSEPIDLGIVADYTSSVCNKLGVLWGKDGSLTILVDGVVKATIPNATVTVPNYDGTDPMCPYNVDRIQFDGYTTDIWMTVHIKEVKVHYVEKTLPVLTQQVALGNNIGFIFKGSNISATVGENTYSGNEVTVDLAAAQMNDVVSVIVNDDSGLTYTQNYTVRDYALSILALEDAEYAVYHDMVKAMLHYGAAAQAHFDYNAENPVNADIGDLGDVTVPNKRTVDKAGTCPEGIAYYGTSLIFRNKIVIRFYFELADGCDIANYTFTDNDGKPFEVKRDGQSNLYYMDVENINPQQYEDIYTVTVGKTVGEYTVSYTCLHYITRTYHNNLGNAEKANLVNLMKAMYAYHTAAEALLGDNVQ